MCFSVVLPLVQGLIAETCFRCGLLVWAFPSLCWAESARMGEPGGAHCQTGPGPARLRPGAATVHEPGKAARVSRERTGGGWGHRARLGARLGPVKCPEGGTLATLGPRSLWIKGRSLYRPIPTPHPARPGLDFPHPLPRLLRPSSGASGALGRELRPSEADARGRDRSRPGLAPG